MEEKDRKHSPNHDINIKRKQQRNLLKEEGRRIRCQVFESERTSE